MIDLYDIAQKIINIDIYEARNNDLTPEILAEDLKDLNTCHETINYLLDIIENMED